MIAIIEALMPQAPHLSSRSFKHVDRPCEPISEDLRPVKVIRPPAMSLAAVAAGVRTLRGFSGLFYSLTALRLNVRYKQSVLGWLWAILQPLSLVVIYTVVFTTVTTIDTGN